MITEKRGRPLEYDQEKVIESALLLFWKKGYEATSLQDLLDATKISKSSFYYAFGNKYQLFEQCLERFRDRQVAQMLKDLEQAPNGRVFIENCLKQIAKITYSEEHLTGCFVMDSTLEFAGRNPEVSILVSSATKRFIEVLKLAISKGQAEGVISKYKDAGMLAFYLMSSIAGLRTMIKLKVDPKILKQIVAVTISTLTVDK